MVQLQSTRVYSGRIPAHVSVVLSLTSLVMSSFPDPRNCLFNIPPKFLFFFPSFGRLIFSKFFVKLNFYPFKISSHYACTRYFDTLRSFTILSPIKPSIPSQTRNPVPPCRFQRLFNINNRTHHRCFRTLNMIHRISKP